jgi:hypothetical protein
MSDLVERVAHVDTLRQELVRASTMTEAELDALVAHAITVIRNEALVESAKVADDAATNASGPVERGTAKYIAAAIRGLMK